MLIGSAPTFIHRELTEDVDVLVMGSGIAGLTAAISAKVAQPRARVVLIEKSEITGGASRMSGGIINLPLQNTPAEINDM